MRWIAIVLILGMVGCAGSGGGSGGMGGQGLVITVTQTGSSLETQPATNTSTVTVTIHDGGTGIPNPSEPPVEEATQEPTIKPKSSATQPAP